MFAIQHTASTSKHSNAFTSEEHLHSLPTYLCANLFLTRSILLTARHHHNHQTSNPITSCTLVPEPITPIHCSLQSPCHLKEEHFPDSTQSYSILISSTSTRAFIKKTASTTITGNLKRRVAMPETHPLQCTYVCPTLDWMLVATRI
ncbi:hypothetical protein FOIG_00499 [Fusarium odoratissimum NRRL 54006]|uniref:Uncharacterized protein n=2 Tax=Fusarium oxysporum species complex TaxID=171631 RepID=X0K9U3_FUSO5|nr:uncharacterized protein FOIG_00499 [Fusarium odoratissimum NRRL 54006]XP_031072434.1 uncharacterized protein FOIG_00499 [Fusarium odoratissimum NRRL 54006]EXM10344.1 hypothetical protein FOIG_00499 [Fusarium odoratissimum NRRL 54006]EXM10345.1 hypothetical protein FOIG_00499 [Fusarium odoratissimum NRRL 54006]TXC05206.1 hypothetical protein FocTR4_00001656 [Fusarium oxysporum f. sp. cubense]